MPTRNRAWSSTMRIRVTLAEVPTIRTAATAFRPAVVDRAHLLSSPPGGSRRDRQPDDGAAVRTRSYVESGADQLGSLAHELEPEVAPAAGRHRSDVEPATVVADLEDPVVAVDAASPR